MVQLWPTQRGQTQNTPYTKQFTMYLYSVSLFNFSKNSDFAKCQACNKYVQTVN